MLVRWFHAHIYFNSLEERARAVKLHDNLVAQNFKTIQISRLVDRPVGPHPVPMFEADFTSEVFAEVVPWLMYNRDGLSILVHPITEPEDPNGPMDHTARAMWLGQQLPLDIGMLEELAAQALKP